MRTRFRPFWPRMFIRRTAAQDGSGPRSTSVSGVFFGSRNLIVSPFAVRAMPIRFPDASITTSGLRRGGTARRLPRPSRRAVGRAELPDCEAAGACPARGDDGAWADGADGPDGVGGAAGFGCGLGSGSVPCGRAGAFGAAGAAGVGAGVPARGAGALGADGGVGAVGVRTVGVRTVGVRTEEAGAGDVTVADGVVTVAAGVVTVVTGVGTVAAGVVAVVAGTVTVGAGTVTVDVRTVTVGVGTVTVGVVIVATGDDTVTVGTGTVVGRPAAEAPESPKLVLATNPPAPSTSANTIARTRPYTARPRPRSPRLAAFATSVLFPGDAMGKRRLR